ncbi:MAG: hypothetical protein IT373_32280 [Polyangiaceae bacterium]|nr:hypothetical protein [Polyangiaceae bacterium]
MIQVRCKCGFSFEAQDAARGRSIECLQCQSPLVIGAATAASATPAGRTDVEKRVGAKVLVARSTVKLAAVAEVLLDFVARSGPPAPRAIFWWGPVPLFLLPEGTDRLRICEPDLRLEDSRASPQRDVSSALALITLQSGLHEATRTQPEEFRLVDALLAYRGTRDERRVFLHRKYARRRLDDGTTDTGWFLGPDPDYWAQLSDREANAPSNYALIPIRELYYTRPAVVAALGLPMDWVAHADRDILAKVYDPADRLAWQFDPARRVFG